jgi:hypothetical protein
MTLYDILPGLALIDDVRKDDSRHVPKETYPFLRRAVLYIRRYNASARHKLCPYRRQAAQDGKCIMTYSARIC